MKLFKPVAIAVVATILFSSDGQAPASKSHEHVVRVPVFKEMSFQDIDAAMSNILTSIEGIESDIAEQLQDPQQTADGKLAAIYLLGELHAQEFEMGLIKNVTFAAPRRDPSRRGPGRWGSQPAVEALVKIGHSSAGDITSYLAVTGDSDARKLLCTVLLGTGFGESSVRALKGQLGVETNPEWKANLEAAITELQGMLDTAAKK